VEIKKLYAPWSPDFWSPRMQKKYGMDSYHPNTTDQKEPVIVFGCYGRGTKADIMQMNGLVVIVWSGSDSVRLHEMGQFVQFCRDNSHRVFHIAHSHWIQTDLKHFGLEYIDKVVIPLDLSEFVFEEEYGDNVYHYGTHQRMWYYGTHIMKKLEKKWAGAAVFPKIYKTVQNSYKGKELYDIYKDCFIGVRLTEHDNMAMSVVEMGLMGRRSIFNGNVPCAIPYPCPPYDRYEPRTRKELVWRDESILGTVGNMILEHRGTPPDKLLAEEMREFVHDDRDWLNTEFYG
jgi:hypothetical protein